MSAVRARDLELVSPAPRAAWAGVLRGDPDALPTQSPAWTDAVCASGRFADASRLYLMPDGRRLVLPMVRRRAGGPAGVEASHPTHWGFGGLVADGGVTATDVRFVLDDLAARRLAWQSIRPNPLHGRLYSAHRSAACVVDRPPRTRRSTSRGGADVVWKGFADSRRRARAQGRAAGRRGGVRHERPAAAGVLRAVRAFRAALGRAAARAAVARACSHPLPRHVAEVAADRATPRRRMPRSGSPATTAAPVAAIIVLFGVNVHYTRGAMDKELAGPLRANDLLMWHAIQAACASGAALVPPGRVGKLRVARRLQGAVRRPALRLPRAAAWSGCRSSGTDHAARTVVKRLIGFREP